MATKGSLRICKAGHRYYKSSDCPVCPICEREKKTEKGFLAAIAAPARRALERAGIKTLVALSKWSEKELLELHGMGPGSIPTLKKALKGEGLPLRKR